MPPIPHWPIYLNIIMMIQPLTEAGNFPIKTLVARQWPTILYTTPTSIPNNIIHDCVIKCGSMNVVEIAK